jgi:hypothetical protein
MIGTRISPRHPPTRNPSWLWPRKRRLALFPLFAACSGTAFHGRHPSYMGVHAGAILILGSQIKYSQHCGSLTRSLAVKKNGGNVHVLHLFIITAPTSCFSVTGHADRQDLANSWGLELNNPIILGDCLACVPYRDG